MAHDQLPNPRDLEHLIEQVAAQTSLYVLRIDRALVDINNGLEDLNRSLSGLHHRIDDLHERVERLAGDQRL